ncbi:MAG TPA: DUF1761 domain-containing protein [Candidatus Paceibacterota bacterium]
MVVDVNVLAVLACAIAAMILGVLWYGPLFGKTWAQLMGWGSMTAEMLKEKQKGATPGYIASFVGALVMAYILSHSIAFAASYPALASYSHLQVGLTTGFFMWLGFVAPVTVGTVFWDGRPWRLWFINAGYYLVQLLVMGTILALWV